MPFPSAAQEGSCLGPWGRAPFLLISPPLTLGSQAGMCPSSAVNPSSVTLQKRAVLASDPRTGQTNHGVALTLRWVSFVGLGCACVCVCACSLPPSLIPSHQILHFPDWILLSSLSRRDYFLLNSCLTHDTFKLTVPANSMYMRPIHNCINGRWSGALCSSSSLSFLSHLITSHTVRFTAQFLCL